MIPIDPRQKRFGSKDFFSRDKVTSGSELQINSALNSFRYIGLFEHGFESELITKMVAPCHSTALFRAPNKLGGIFFDLGTLSVNHKISKRHSTKSIR